MSNNARDTQFQGFAKLLFQEMQADLLTLSVATNEEAIRSAESIIQQCIARRAYDFACHVGRLIRIEDGLFTTEEIPDMTELPKEQDD